VLLASVAAFGSTAAQAAPAPSASVTAAKSCRSGYVHAVTPGGHKCLHAGEFCSRSHSYQVVYHRHGFHCRRNGHLASR
jgi:hypothetical protein